MYYVHWLTHWLDGTQVPTWHAMPVDEYREMGLELSFLSNPEAYIDQQPNRDEPE